MDDQIKLGHERAMAAAERARRFAQWPPENSLACAAEFGRARAYRRRNGLVTAETAAERIIFYVALAIVLVLFCLAGLSDILRP